MDDFPIYMVMVSYGKKELALAVIDDFLKAEKPVHKTRMLVVENSPTPLLDDEISDPAVQYFYFKNRNKAKAINFAIGNLIPEKEVLIICVDNDISFDVEYLTRYLSVVKKRGTSFYFGTSFFVKRPDYDSKLAPYLSGSALGLTDEHFLQMKKLMFLGCSYGFFKSQWKTVGGLDERFSPGSKFNLAAEESIFQKKLVHNGFKPFFIENNSVEHKPEPELYTFGKVRERLQNNGYTHGFQNLIISTTPLKVDCLKQLFGHFKRCVILFMGKDRIKFRMKLAYSIGFLQAFFLFFRIDNRKSYLDSNFIEPTN